MEIPTGAASTSAPEEDRTLSTPVKPPKRPILPSDGRSNSISTPEKPIELPRRSARREVALSVTQVKKAALDLQSKTKAKACDAGSGTGDVPVEEKREGDRRGKRSIAEHSINLPEEYEKLGQMFNSLVTSIRLMRMKGQTCTFSNVCPKVQHLTDRRFNLRHLAQMKYVLSEAMVLKKVLSRDEATSCMKPDIQILILPDALGTDMNLKKGSDYSILNKVFRHRLGEYFSYHPEDDGIPEGDLPEPFGRSKLKEPLKLSEVAIPGSTSPQTKSSVVSPVPKIIAPSHMPQSFQRRFSQKSSVIISKLTVETVDCKMESTSSFASSIECSVQNPSNTNLLSSSFDEQLASMSSPKFSAKVSVEPSDSIGWISKSSLHLDGTPSRLASTPTRMMMATPELQAPKRCRPVDDCTPPTKRSVKRGLSLDEQTDLDDIPSVLRFLPEALLQSVKEKERRAIEDQEANRSKEKRRQKMILCLPKFFDMIRLIFQSSNQSVITKQQLIYKIVSSHLNIVDKGEIEEQLNLLQELVPDWICGKTAPTGEFIYSLNKVVSPESIRQILSEAK